MSTFYVYRAGLLEKPEEYGRSQEKFAAVDALRPPGRPGRLEGIFCTPDLEGLVRWVLANARVQLPNSPSQLRVRPEGLWVYSVRAWDRVAGPVSREEERRAYWESGVPLVEWEAHASSQGLSGFDYEVLVPLSSICSQRAVSEKRCLQNARVGTSQRELRAALRGPSF